MDFLRHLACIFLLSGGILLPLRATVYLSDSFDYLPGPLAGQGAWVRGPGADDPSEHIAVVNAAVQFDWTVSTGVNNLVRALWDSIDPGPISTGAVYAMFDLEVARPPLTAENLRPAFFSFGNPTGSAQRGMVGLKPGNGAGTFRLGVASVSQLQGSFAFNGQDLMPDRTYRVMVRFTVATGETSLWIDSVDPATDPVATVTPRSYSAIDIRRVNLRMLNADGTGGTTDLGRFTVDNLLVTTLAGPAEEGPFRLTASAVPAGVTPSLMGVNLGHFLEGSNALPRMRYLEGNLARVFLNGSHFISKPLNRYDQPIHGDGVATYDLFLQRRNLVRSNPDSGPWINWEYYEQRWADFRTTGSNAIDARYAVESLVKTGHDVLIQATLTPANMPFETEDDWAGRWEYWKFYYAFSFMMARDYGITRFQMYNEPNHAASGISGDLPGYLERLRLASDAIQAGVADASAVTGGNLVGQVYAPVTAGFRPEWADAVLGQLNSSIVPSGGFERLFHRFTWQNYNLTPAAFGSQVREVDAFVRDRLNGQHLPLALSEFNVHTARSFSEMEATLDTPSRFARLAGIYVNLINEGMDTLALFKFSQTYSADEIGTRKNGLYYTEHSALPLNVGGLSSGGEVARLFNRGFRGGRVLLESPTLDVVSPADVPFTAVHDEDTGKRYLAIANQSAAAVKWDLDLSPWLGEAEGVAIVHEVSAARAGSVANIIAAGRGDVHSLVQPAVSFWLIEVAPLAGWWTRSHEPSVAGNPRAGTFSSNAQTAGEVLAIANPPSDPDGRLAGVLGFTIPDSGGHRLDHASLRVEARSTSDAEQALHLYAVAAESLQDSYSWNGYEHLRPSTSAYTEPSIAGTAIVQETENMFFLGTLKATPEWAEARFDLTLALSTLSAESVEVLLVRELRDPANFDLDSDPVEIRNSGAGSPRLTLHFRPDDTFSQGYAEWVAVEQLPPDEAGPRDDPGGTRIANFLAYALGLTSANRTAKQLPSGDVETVAGQDYLTMEFSAPRSDVLYEVQASEDLHEWRAENVEVTGPDGDGVVRARLPLLGDQRAFLRLRVSSIEKY